MTDDKQAEEAEAQPQIQEVVVNDELINNKMNMLAGMLVELTDKVDKLVKKL